MQDVQHLCDLWPSDAELARDIGVAYPTVAAWKQRGSIPAPYWRDLVRAARARGIRGVTADVLAELHARHAPDGHPGFAEQEAPPFAEPQTDAAATPARDPADNGHFSRFKHLRRSNFSSSDEIVGHIRALREEWDRP